MLTFVQVLQQGPEQLVINFSQCLKHVVSYSIPQGDVVNVSSPSIVILSIMEPYEKEWAVDCGQEELLDWA